DEASVILTRLEEPILQPKVEVRAYRHIRLREQLPGEFAVGLVELGDAGIAEAGPDPTANARLTAEIEPAVDHRIPAIGRPVDAEIRAGGERRAGAGIQRADECRTQLVIIDMAVPVTQLAFEPEHPEVVAADRVDIE